jgi:hypothetical protein
MRTYLFAEQDWIDRTGLSVAGSEATAADATCYAWIALTRSRRGLAIPCHGVRPEVCTYEKSAPESTIRGRKNGAAVLPATPGPRSAAPPLPLKILSALVTELSGLRLTIQILTLTGLASTDRSLPLALRK